MTTAEKNKILIVATYGPDNPERCPGAFVFAQEAAKTGADVGLVFVLQAPLLLKKGVADSICAKEGGRTIRKFIDDTLDAGVQFFACDAAMRLCDITADELIEEVDMIVGPSFVITEGLKADLALTF